MSRLKRNIFANFGGQAATTVIALVTLPLYVKFLGVDGYGLVSFLLALQALTAVLDFGLSTTANREVSRYIAQQRAESDRRDLVRTLEWFYVGLGVLIFLALSSAAPWLSVSWFQTSAFDVATLETCLLIAAGSIALRWPVSLYQGILRGTERQVTLNVINSAVALLRGGGTILVLVFIARSVVVFYWWQLVFSAIELAVCVLAVSRLETGFTGRTGRFQLPVLRDLWRFSLRVGGLSLFALILKQLDKIIISKLLPISHLGFYNAANLASNGIPKVGQPVQAATFPRLTHLHESRDDPGLASTFQRSTQLVAFLSVPVGCVLMLFPHDVLWLWTRNMELADGASTALAIFSAAMILNSMMGVAFSLQLAAGLTWLPLYTNAIGAATLAPLMYFLVKTRGLDGGAVAWLIFNAMYYLVVPPIMFRYVLRGQYRAWLGNTLLYIGTGVLVFGAARLVAVDDSLAAKAVVVVIALVAYGGIALGLSPALRGSLLRWPSLRVGPRAS